MPSKKYKEVYQTWSLIKTQHLAVSDDVVQEESTDIPSTFRFKMQTARIEKRMSIAELATNVVCDVETLAAFERGAEVIDTGLQSRIRKVLGM